jgi:hypothetical protein
MNLRRAYPLLATIAVLGAIAAYVEIAHTTAPSSDGAVNSGEAAPVRTAATSPDAAVERPPPGGNPLWALPLKQLSITRERPIFSPSRRPPPPATPTYVAPVAVRTPQKSRNGPRSHCSVRFSAAARALGFSSIRRRGISCGCDWGRIMRAGHCGPSRLAR